MPGLVDMHEYGFDGHDVVLSLNSSVDGLSSNWRGAQDAWAEAAIKRIRPVPSSPPWSIMFRGILTQVKIADTHDKRSGKTREQR
jgi:hypothetical protein